jgi:hypothetical protein
MDRYSIKYTFDAGRALEAPRDNVEIDYSFDTTDFSQVEILIVPVLGWASSLYQVLAKRCPPAALVKRLKLSDSLQVDRNHKLHQSLGGDSTLYSW